MDGLQVQWLLHPDTTDMQRLVRAHLQRQVTVPLVEIDLTEDTP